MSVKIRETIRQHMGWCPCAGISTSRPKNCDGFPLNGRPPQDGGGTSATPVWLYRIPGENPWVLSILASAIGSAAMTLGGFILGFFAGSLADMNFPVLAIGSFAGIFVICFITCMLEFS